MAKTRHTLSRSRDATRSQPEHLIIENDTKLDVLTDRKNLLRNCRQPNCSTPGTAHPTRAPGAPRPPPAAGCTFPAGPRRSQSGETHDEAEAVGGSRWVSWGESANLNNPGEDGELHKPKLRHFGKFRPLAIPLIWVHATKGFRHSTSLWIVNVLRLQPCDLCNEKTSCLWNLIQTRTPLKNLSNPSSPDHHRKQ